MILLETKNLRRSFGGLNAVDGVDFKLNEGEVRAVIGPNGAGKTTFVSLIAGRVRPTSGQVFFAGEDITSLPPHTRVQRGIAYTFQITSIYPNLTVHENVELADHGRGSVRDCLNIVGLFARANQLAGTLAYGHQRLLEVAMGLALKPRLLILDEPTQGLADSEIESFITLMRGVASRTTILLIEHNMKVVMDLAQRITVLAQGRILAEGTPAEVRANTSVQAAYLGSRHAAA